MSATEEILSQISLSDLAQQLGVSESEADQAVRKAVPALVSGMQANAQDPAGASSLATALADHAGGGGAFDVTAVDTDDGEKIVSHVFGDNQTEVVGLLGGEGSGGGIMSKLLPMLAPLVLSWLGDKFLGGGGAESTAGSGGGGGGLGDLLGGGLGDLLGGLTGGGGGSSQSSAGGGLGDLLGGVLGGGEGGGDLDVSDLLGGLLGGGTKG